MKEVVGGDLERPHVNLAIAVPSVRPERREAIRKTWLKWGDDRVVLRFFTEPSNEADNENSKTTPLAEESRTHGDIIIQDISAGMNFGVKLLEAMKWMSSHYSFDFFLRLDDDYFLCLEHLLNELSCLLMSDAQQSPIYSGTRGCGTVPAMDEAYILLSSVIVDRILAASDLQCHALGTTTAGAWLRIGGPGNPEGDVAWVSDRRLNWTGGSWRRFKPNSRACEHYIGFHHTYPDEMNELWGEISSKMNVSQSTAVGCEHIYRYEDDGRCPRTSRELDDEVLQAIQNNEQPCDSFKLRDKTVWCGRQGC
ncbi:unnamed protein product [Ectocarpus sp. 4 AP-2014]